MSEVCICSSGPGTGCYICKPERWIEYTPSCWRVRTEDEMNEDKNVVKEAIKTMPKVEDPMELETSTRLLDKNYSPLIVRKYQLWGWPLFISLICDISLSDLDKVINSYKKLIGKPSDDIQEVRNWCGGLSDYICEHYDNIKDGCVEGVAVLWYVDKMFVSSLYGDFMVHASCKAELFAIINTLPHI